MLRGDNVNGIQAPRKSTGSSIALGVAGGLLAVFGLLAYFTVNAGYAACNSIVGQLGQAADQSTSNDCAAVTLAHWAGVAAIPIGIGLFIYAIARASK